MFNFMFCTTGRGARAEGVRNGRARERRTCVRVGLRVLVCVYLMAERTHVRALGLCNFKRINQFLNIV